MTEPKMDIYTTNWCSDCRVAKRILREMGIDFREIDIEEDPEAAALVVRENQGKRRVPTIAIGGRFYGNPLPAELRALVAAARGAAGTLTAAPPAAPPSGHSGSTPGE